MPSNNLKITISGAHSQGKTTLLNRLARDQYLAEKNFQFGASSTRDLLKIGVNISEAGSDVTQALVVAKHIENAYRDGNYMLDRCIMDSLAYGIATRRRNGISAETLVFNEIIFNSIVDRYNLMFYIKPELPLKNDGIRSTDIEYFDAVVDGFRYIMEEYGHKLPLVVLSGSVEERYNTAMHHIKSTVSVENS